MGRIFRVCSALSMGLALCLILSMPKANAAATTYTINPTAWQAPATPFMSAIFAATTPPTESIAFRNAPSTIFNPGLNSPEPVGGSGNEAAYIPLSLNKVCADNTVVNVTVGAYARNLTAISGVTGGDGFTVSSGILDISPFTINGLDINSRTTVGAYTTTSSNTYATTAGHLSSVAAFVNNEVVTINDGTHYQGTITSGLPTITLAYDDANCTYAPTISNAATTIVSSSTVSGTVVINGTSLNAQDADGDTLTYSVTAGNGASYFAINSANGNITTTRANVPLGTYTLTVQVSDGHGGTALATVTITVVGTLADTGTDATTPMYGAISAFTFGLLGFIEYQRRTKAGSRR